MSVLLIFTPLTKRILLNKFSPTEVREKTLTRSPSSAARPLTASDLQVSQADPHGIVCTPFATTCNHHDARPFALCYAQILFSTMKKAHFIQFVQFAVLVPFILIGCQPIVSPDDPEPEVRFSKAGRTSSKFRFSHLFEYPRVHQQKKASGVHQINSSDPENEEARLIIGFSDTSIDPNKLLQRYGSAQLMKLLQRYDGDILYTYGMSVVIENTFTNQSDFDAMLNDLFAAWEEDSDIAWFEPDIDIEQGVPGEEEASGNNQIVPWGVQNVGYASADVSNVDLYVIDSRVNDTDVNLVEVVYFNEDSSQDQHDMHGYFVASIAAAIDDNSGIVGVAPGARVHSFVVAEPDGQIILSSVVQALDEIVSRKNASPTTPVVVNLSLGADVQAFGYNALDEVVEVATEAGIVVVVAAGDMDQDLATVSPAHATSAITVGAFDINDTFASFSNYGSGIDILAPGVQIQSLGQNVSGQLQIVTNSGTSVAAPHVAGAAVVYLSQNPTATPADVLNALVNAARTDITDVPVGTTNKAVSIIE